ncbi:auxilin-related protein 2-like [Impatiens glandulifera]|uniref:auxilin-related protein 2-like n=1 Tax=Impatiens glandulifera TaxID=253017 RepID=UPI001FB0BD4C|nr:auxilin-related protein 2-like [Impatiens glandulifera]
MDDFGMLARDFGYKPQGKAAPMSASRANIGDAGERRPRYDDHNPDESLFNDVFGGPPKYSTYNDNSKPASTLGDLDYDSIFKSSSTSGFNSTKNEKPSSSPVYDKPVYDEDIFDGLPGLKTKATSSSVRFDDDAFRSISSPPESQRQSAAAFDDLLGNLGRNLKSEASNQKSSGEMDDLLPGFGRTGSSASIRSHSESRQPPTNSRKETFSVLNDPFVVLESTSKAAGSSSSPFADPLDEIGKTGSSRKVEATSSSNSGALFDDIDPLKDRVKEGSPLRTGSNTRMEQTSNSESIGRSSFGGHENHSQKNMSYRSFDESHLNMFDIPSVSDMSHTFEDQVETSGKVWLTVMDFPLVTQPTISPPPSRPPPPRPEAGFFSTRKSTVANQVDELDDFSMGSRSRHNDNAYGEEENANSSAAASAAAMKEAMDNAEARFRYAKEVKEREHGRTSRSKEPSQQEKDELLMQDEQERLEHEKRLKEEEEREQKRLEERERAREVERERVKARQAVDRATREARERAAAEARERATSEARLKAERAAVQRVQAEARERAAIDARGRAEKAAAEARDRASAEAKEKEARERSAATAKAERAAVERVAAEARQRAAVEARDRAAAAVRMSQQKNDNDLESFFSAGSRPSSAPRPRATADPVDSFYQSKGAPDTRKTTSFVSTSSNIRKASSATNIVDDLSSIFGGAPSSGDFQEVEGETEERRRARLERNQRTQERAAKALAEKNQRDLQAQHEQDERHRIAETLDIEIKRWSAGKEGNLRALLSTLQYVLWPECGWQPVSLTDLIVGASVKKVYRKATLCIHPDKVQQKGATLQQKYVAEKVFDLLKEAWNKFNSEELF